MRRFPRPALSLALALALGLQVPAAAAEAGTPFALTVEQLLAWTPDVADERNVARVPLAERFVDAGRGPDPQALLDPGVRVLIAPDGMDNFGNHLTPQPRFNLYTFTHWAQVDILNWFAGTARNTVNIPARPWVEAAHRNGVKVIGTVFFAPVAWGGSLATVEAFLREDGKGGFPAADRLVAIARHHAFDGWLINQETDLGNPALGAKMARFMAYLTRIAPAPMEIHWYDAMLPNGRVVWQNQLNRRNAPLLQDGGVRVSDAMFLNYQWTPEGLREGAALAERLGRSRYDLFIGADLWPKRKNAQAALQNRRWLRGLREKGTGRAFSSIALFAPNFNFNAPGEGFGLFQSDPRDAALFYDGEVRLFAGDDRNMAAGGSAASAVTGEWEGIAALVPARSTITRLPFRTSFNTGHGLVDVRHGRIVGGPWHDMSRQDILPSWQFAYTPGARLEIGYDFDRPYHGGNSLRVAPREASRRTVEIPLFLTALPVEPRTRLALTTQTASDGYAVRLTMVDGRTADYPIAKGPAWRRQQWCIGGISPSKISRISLILLPGRQQNRPPAELLVGALSVTFDAGAQLLHRGHSGACTASARKVGAERG